MPARPRTPMDPENRAKQFLPFAALRGFEKALAERERICVPRPALSEDYLMELEQKLLHVHCGDMVEAVYYRQGETLQVTGIAARIDPDCRILQIVNQKIPFDDLLKLDICHSTYVRNTRSHDQPAQNTDAFLISG